MYCVSAHCHPPSPPDCLVLLVFKDKADKAQGSRERASVTLEEICGVEAGQWHDGVAFTLAVLCLNQAALLGFDSKEALQAWDARLRYSLGEGGELRPCFWFGCPFPFAFILFIYRNITARNWKQSNCLQAGWFIRRAGRSLFII